LNFMQTQIPPALFSPQALVAVPPIASDPLELARAGLLAPAGLDENSVARVLGDVMGHAVDYADIYFQMIREESWALEDGIVKDGAHSIDHGVGVRALAGEKTGFAYSDEVVLPALLEAAQAARAIARSGSTGVRLERGPEGGHGPYPPIDRVEARGDGGNAQP
jgi:TldD protein